jgi:hypothetical protein
MLALLAFLALQASAQDVSKLSVHELVKDLPRFGDHSFDLSREKDPPLSIRAQNELRERMRNGAILDLADWKTILLEKGYLCWRERWPKDEPFAIGLHVPPLWESLSIELTPRLAGWQKAGATDLHGLCGFAQVDTDYQELGRLSGTDRKVEFGLVVSVPLWGKNDATGATTTRVDRLGSITIPLTPVSGIDDAVPPLADRALRERIGMRIASRLELWECAAAFTPPSVTVAGKRTAVAAAIALNLDGEIRHKGQLIESFSCGLRRDSPHLCDLTKLPVAVVRGTESALGWSLVLKGSPKGVLRDWEATQYWAGEIEVPLADLIRR